MGLPSNRANLEHTQAAPFDPPSLRHLKQLLSYCATAPVTAVLPNLQGRRRAKTRMSDQS
jgi:hypothetical protein